MFIRICSVGFEEVFGAGLRILGRRDCDNLCDSGVVHSSRGSVKVAKRVETGCSTR